MYKVTKLYNKEHYSFIARDDYCIKYPVNEWMDVPVFDGVMCPFFVFDNYGQACYFAKVNKCNKLAYIWECMVEGESEALIIGEPHRIDYSIFWQGHAPKYRTRCSPDDTYICNRIKLMELANVL